jgi:peptide/nickel transport system substrate-binding protein
MFLKRNLIILITAFMAVVFVVGNSACGIASLPTPTANKKISVTKTQETELKTAAPTATPEPPLLLTICLGNEPESLFLYGDASHAARSVRQAIYDGPFDILGYEVSYVILEEMPEIQKGDVYLDGAKVDPGDLVVDYSGKLTNLKEGVAYSPSGCREQSCIINYTGEEPVIMDQLVVSFELIPELKWSDGAPLTADDSQYSFEVAKELNPRARAGLIARTDSYRALDEVTVEWRGVPGFIDPDYRTNFFSPLPRHAWGEVSVDELLSADGSSLRPIGWGPYVIDRWVPGEAIYLSVNQNYFRAGEGLPNFDQLVYRFLPDKEQALEDLRSGACDVLDESLSGAIEREKLAELALGGEITYETVYGGAWEHIDFGIDSLDSALPALFKSVQVRQAIAYCIDRERIVETLFPDGGAVLDSYLPPDHPYYDSDNDKYAYDPQQGAALLQSAGWVDHDQDPETPRQSKGVQDVPDGTVFVFSFLTSDEHIKEGTAQIVKESLLACGVEAEIESHPLDELYAPGPDGSIFGRNYSMAQFAWVTTRVPPCYLYSTAEIPGPYPEYQKGWGGANNTGFSLEEYDRVCISALTSLPDWDSHHLAHDQAQAIYSEQLPSIPLYLHLRIIAARPDICGIQPDPSAGSVFWNLEEYEKGKEN